MTPTAAERDASTLRTLCDLAASHGPQTIVDFCALTNLHSSVVRAAANQAVDQGYLRYGRKSPGKTNRRKTYARTRRKLPGSVHMPERAPMTEFGIFRHWMDVALYGPAPSITTACVEGRVFQQTMTVTEDETV